MLEELGLIKSALDCHPQHLPNKEGLVMEDLQSSKAWSCS